MLDLYEDPELYDRLMPPGFCETFYCGLAQAVKGPVLELACGTGRLTVPLALTGADVTGLDLSAPMLEAARRKANEANARVDFRQGDMRSFDLGRRFALIILSCNSLGHLTRDEDVLAALGRIESHLEPGGMLAFDIVNPQLPRLARCSSEVHPVDHLSLIQIEERMAYDAIRQVETLRWLVGCAESQRKAISFELRVFFPREVPILLTAAGLRLVERFGDFRRSELTHGSVLQVCVAGLK